MMNLSLTDAQHRRLDALEEDAQVVGATPDGRPIIRRGDGKVSSLNGFGRLVPVPGHALSTTSQIVNG